MQRKRDTIVLYPSPGMGHLISMVELGKRIHSITPAFSTISILIPEAPFNTGSTAPYIHCVTTSHPSITFHHLPSPISLSTFSSPSPHHETLIFHLVQLNNPNVIQTLKSISLSFSIRALVYDMFCATVIDVTTQLNIPTYCFFTSGAAVLAVFLHFPTLHRLHSISFKDLQSPLHVPGVPPFPASAMPLPILDRNDESYHGSLHATSRIPKSSGIIVNSFDALETRAMKAILDGSCVPDGPTPPVSCIGPLIAPGDSPDKSDCLAWLDSQPRRSVVFLCFGSLGLFSAAQLKEIAVGLEKSGQRFLWVVRSPPTEDKSKRFLAPPDPDLDALLPEGFMERTKDRGMVVKSWAPQVAVLKQESVGGFVTHCGWNSALEAVCEGVPMLAWPLYAEQHINRVFMVEEMKIALPLEMDDKGFVNASQLERGVRELMDSEQGKALSQWLLAMKESSMAAMSEGGSSYTALTELTQLWIGG
ncbi:UDP-glycosyltransferase 88B1-like [Magnolia sinica]|uniref:UDP-glycosyltransferase 88B1-like n=1 Tax=Magnolia sinica TaxID=86752 RepID=UPI00265A2737|nr:UDP-glycosyltransferase 88B1-like [Magnolia sinica]